jgi:uncharacterized protein
VTEIALAAGRLARDAAVPSAIGREVAGPVQPDGRIELVDVLRGFALLGIMLPNWQSTSGALWFAIRHLDEGAFFTSYSFLFGLGFSIQLIRSEGRKATPFAALPLADRDPWRHRSIASSVHRSGDILLNYAILAGLLLFVRRWDPRLLLALAAACLVFSMSPARPGTTVPIAQVDPPAWCRMVPGTDNYRQSVCTEAARVRALLTDFAATAQGGRFRQFKILGMFVLGLYVGRRRILENVARHTRALMWVAGVALVLGLAGRGLEVFKTALPESFAG